MSGLTRAGGDGGRTPLPPAPMLVWEFLDASSQIEHPNPHSGFRAASEGDLDNDGDLDVPGDPIKHGQNRLLMNRGGMRVDETRLDFVPVNGFRRPPEPAPERLEPRRRY